jgi:glycosyltransferase involved in cell wall biosynthesis
VNLPFVTFLIPTHNRADLVSRAINSVLGDHTADPALFEVVVVDDGSTDNTAERLAALGASSQMHIRYLSPNRGVAAARNAGIEIARGEWLVLLDSDNQMLPGLVMVLIAELMRITRWPDNNNAWYHWARTRPSSGRRAIPWRAFLRCAKVLRSSAPFRRTRYAKRMCGLLLVSHRA